MTDIAKKPIKITETILRDAHQSLIATRMTTEQVLLLSELLQVLLLVLQQELLQVRRLSVLLQQLHCIHCH